VAKIKDAANFAQPLPLCGKTKAKGRQLNNLNDLVPLWQKNNE
jgi:hypothetical protein